MGQSANCCTNQPTEQGIGRQIISLEDGEACRKWLEDFFNNYPKIQQIYSKKPKYCYKIDKEQLTEKEGLTIIGNMPDYGAVGEVLVMYKEGYLYEGDMKEGVRDGCGRIIAADGSCYEGQWKGNEPDGKGTYQEYEPRMKLTGIWSSGYLTGKGRAIYQDGSVYQGDFYMNSRHGNGRIQYADGTIYEGSFKSNQPQGFGTLIGINHKYEGSWRAGKMDGAGKSYWYNEDDQLLETYEGQYVNGVKHGHGEYRWAGGRVYMGEWEEGDIKKKEGDEEKERRASVRQVKAI